MTASRCVSTIEKFIELTNQKGPLMIKLFVRVSRFQAGFRLTGSRPKIKMLFLNWLSHMVIDVRSRSCRTRKHYQTKFKQKGSVHESTHFWNRFNFDIFCFLHLLAKSGKEFGNQPILVVGISNRSV